jgi:leucyl-tRNA synthetase
MSKSKGNIVNPDEIVAELGADSLRLYEMFMGPLTEMKPWDTKGIVGVRRFLEKVWGLQNQVSSTKFQVSSIKSQVSSEDDKKLDDKELQSKRLLHQTIKKVTDDIESLSFNTAISQMMILVNAWRETPEITKADFEPFLKILAPFAPHLGEEIWENLGHSKSIFQEDWPRANPELLKVDKITIAIQINGKKRDTIDLPSVCSEEETRKKVLALPRVQKYIKGKMIHKWVYIPGKIVNIVTSY